MRKRLRLGVAGAVLALAVVIVAVVVVALVGGGGYDDTAIPIPSVLESVCSQTQATLPPDVIDVSEPRAGAAVSSPLRVAGKITAVDGLFYISLVTADGTHVIDYPARVNASGSLVSFDQQVPFSYFEQTPACVWVYRQDIDSPESVRIPVVIQPAGSPTNGAQ